MTFEQEIIGSPDYFHTDSFDNIINYRLNKVKEEFKRFGAKGEKNVFSERGVTKKIHKCL